MNIADLFKNDANEQLDPRQSVVIYFNYGEKSLEKLHELESKLRIVLYNEGAGELEGHQMALDLLDGFLYLYGDSAEALFKAIRPTLLATPFMKNAEIRLRFKKLENDDVSEIEFILE